MSYSPQPTRNHSSDESSGAPPFRDDSQEKSTTSAMNGALTHAQLTSFNAYPLEYSSSFLKPDNQVLFIPLTPTDLPLTLPESTSDILQSQTMNPQIHRQPLCHGFFFPQTINQTTVGYPVRKVEDTNAPSELSAACANAVNEHPDFGPDETVQLQQLLLQQLIHLQLEKQRINGDKKESQPNFMYQPYSLPLEVPPAYPPPVGMSHPAGLENHSDLCTYIMPVEAQIHEDKGIELHITPRAESFGSDSLERNPSVTMECPSEQLVLYPYTSHRNAAECFSSDNEESVFENNTVPPAQTFTMDDLHQFIRRGSLDRTNETNNDLVSSMKGCTKSGFVLLSIRHERINQDERQSFPSNAISSSVDTQPTSSIQAPSHADAKGNYTENRSSKRLGKKRLKSQRSDPEHRRRATRKLLRTPLKLVQENGIQTNATLDPTEEESKTTASVSRFRVTRFADKHQAWLAPAHSGCFVVHDLWTTKLPEYVIKSMEQVESYKSSTNDTLKAYGTPPLTICAVCQSNQPKACDCGGDVRIRIPD
ncbi:hypothetical protein FGIG_05173 [Fasciola gigantica]|uniref:Uncharacterized protein n=1 Tax=Fasciola gigantica TaxID=46835 RepID=A0A504YGG9_FASGI|nr:hypothetical protein FGIG_05173 [Fasciola gigantica]